MNGNEEEGRGDRSEEGRKGIEQKGREDWKGERRKREREGEEQKGKEDKEGKMGRKMEWEIDLKRMRRERR